GAAVGRIAAGDSRARVDVPGHDNSQMDGFAVAAADLPESGAITLPAGAAIAAGDAPGELAPGTTRPIMTGAPVPAGADAVVPVEESAAGAFDGPGRADGGDGAGSEPGDLRTDRAVTLRPQPTGPGRFVRRRGSDTRRGDIVLRQGQVLTPARLAHLAALGATFDANGPGLAAALTAAGAEVVRVGSVPDDADALVEQLRAGITADDAELIVTSGGVSAGAFEVVRDAAAHRHVTLTFPTVAMQPGGPQGIGPFDLED